MSVPLFIKVQGMLVNLAHVEIAYVEDGTLYMGTASETYEFEYADDAQAGQALQRVQAFLANKNLLLGEVP